MDTSPNGIFIDGKAHSKYVNPPTIDGQIVCYSLALRDFLLASSGGLVNAAPCRTILNDLGELLRIRTLSNNTLDISYATPNDTVVWSSNTIVESALYQAGVDLYRQTDTHIVDAFWFEAVLADNVIIALYTAQSTDDGHTWSVPVDIHTLPTQGSGVTPQCCSPNVDSVIWTDSSVGVDADGNPLTALYLSLRESGDWIDPTLWTLSGQPMGVETNVILPNGVAYPSNLSGLPLSDTSIALAYYGNHFRESFESGVLTQRVYNLDYSADPQHLHWTSPEEIFESISIDDDNNTTQIFTAFPRLQRVASQYWIVALECSMFADHERYHLAFFRSVDGKAWEDRDYRQGAAIGDTPTFAYTYNSGTPFLYTDLIYASLVVTPTRTFICGYDKVFYCPSTILVGEVNPAKQLDLTRYVSDWTVTLPAAPTSATASYTLGNVPKDWASNDILAAEHGVIIKHLAGYYDEDADEDRLIEIGEFHVDNLTQHVADGVESGTIDGIDNTMLLDRKKFDKAWEWKGSEQLSFDQFCDLSAFEVVAGSYTTGFAGRMRAGVVTTNDNFPDDVAALNLNRADGGILTTEFRCDRSWSNTHVGIAFQGQAGENKVFWAILYNRKNTSRFTLNQAIPRVDADKVKLFKYRAPVQQSDVISLDFNTNYFLRVATYHNHVMAWYSTDGIHWTIVIDYLSPATPANEVLPCRLEWWGLIGVQRTKPSGVIGNTRNNNAMQDLFVGTAPRMVALEVELDDMPSILRRVAFGVTQENTSSSSMPDLSVYLLTGDEDSPDDATDDDNVIFSYDASSLFFGAHDSPQWAGANDNPNPQRTRLRASQTVWVAVQPDSALVAGQSYKWASDDSGTYGTNRTKYSDDSGATWSDFVDANLNMAAAIEVEYLDGRIKFYNINFASSERPYTYERLVHQVAAKAGVLELVADSFVDSDSLVLGGDGILWQPTVFGTVGDMSLEGDVTTSAIARVIWGASQIDAGLSHGWRVQFDSIDQEISFYAPSGVLLTRTESLQYIPNSFHAEVVKHGYFLYAYINECLASVCYDPNLFTRVGYVGVDTEDTTWTNVRVPDLTGIVDYWLLAQKDTASQSIQNLIAKPAAGTIARGNFFITPEGKLYISSFSRRTVTGTYQDTMFAADRSQSARFALSQIIPTGNYYAVRWNPAELAKHGRWYDERDVTNAVSDGDAYIASALPFRDAQEKELGHSITGLANFAQWREDVVFLLNPLNHTSGDVIVNDISFHGTNDESTQMLNFRTYIAQVEE